MIILTGASGFIGYNILKSINSDSFFSNHEVIIIDKDDGKKLINNKDINFSQYIDYEDIDKINSQLERADIQKRILTRNIYREYELYLNLVRDLLFISVEKGLNQIYSYPTINDNFLKL